MEKKKRRTMMRQTPSGQFTLQDAMVQVKAETPS